MPAKGRSGVLRKRSFDRLLAAHGSTAVPGTLGSGRFELFPGSVHELGEFELDADPAAELAFERSRSSAEHQRFFELAAGGRRGGELTQHPQDPGNVSSPFVQRECLPEEAFRLSYRTGPADDAAE